MRLTSSIIVASAAIALVGCTRHESVVDTTGAMGGAGTTAGAPGAAGNMAAPAGSTGAMGAMGSKMDTARMHADSMRKRMDSMRARTRKP